MLKVGSDYCITLVHIDDCEGCIIADKILRTAINTTSKHVDYTKMNMTKPNRRFLKSFNITDYPTILFMVKGVCKLKLTGSYPLAVIHRYMDIHFK